jgi:hypothetical protein
MGKHEASRDAGRLSVQLNPRFSVSYLYLAAALIRLGDEVQANRAAQRVLALDPSFTIRRVSALVDLSPPCSNHWRILGGSLACPKGRSD